VAVLTSDDASAGFFPKKSVSHRRMGRRLCLLGGLILASLSSSSLSVLLRTRKRLRYYRQKYYEFTKIHRLQLRMPAYVALLLPLPFSSARRTRSSPKSSSFADDDDAFAFFGQGDLGPLFSSFSSAISMSELDATLRAEAVLSLELLLAQRASSSDVVVVPRRPRHRKSCRHRRWVR
jgi:hypothetical protein